MADEYRQTRRKINGSLFYLCSPLNLLVNVDHKSWGSQTLCPQRVDIVITVVDSDSIMRRPLALPIAWRDVTVQCHSVDSSLSTLASPTADGPTLMYSSLFLEPFNNCLCTGYNSWGFEIKFTNEAWKWWRHGRASWQRYFKEAGRASMSTGLS